MGEALEFDTPVHPAGSIYARAHTALGFPHVVSPLGWSLVGPLGEQSARRTWEEGFGFFKGLSDDPEHRFIGRFGGRVYGNVSTFREMSGRTPGADWRHTDDELVGIGAAALPPHAEPSDVRRWWARTLPRAG